MVSKHVTALFLMAAITVSVIAVAQEFSDPASPTTGRLLANERFTEWDGPKLKSWFSTLNVRQLDADTKPAVELEPKPGKGGHLYHRFAAGHFRPGDLVTFEADCRAAEPEALAIMIWVVGPGGKHLIDVQDLHPGDDAWHRLRASVTVPVEPLERIDVVVTLTQKAQKNAQVALAEAWLLPRQI